MFFDLRGDRGRSHDGAATELTDMFKTPPMPFGLLSPEILRRLDWQKIVDEKHWRNVAPSAQPTHVPIVLQRKVTGINVRGAPWSGACRRTTDTKSVVPNCAEHCAPTAVRTPQNAAAARIRVGKPGDDLIVEHVIMRSIEFLPPGLDSVHYRAGDRCGDQPWPRDGHD